MIELNWNPRFYKRFVKSQDTNRKASEIETDVGYGYVKPMFKSRGHHPLACELLGTMLANWFGLPTFDFAILKLQEEDEIPLGRDGSEMAISGPAFITRKVEGDQWDGSSKSLDKVENTDTIASLVVFDTWTCNWDRCPPDGDRRHMNFGNVFLTSEKASPNKWRLLAIDHTECFSNGHDLSPKIKCIDKVKDRKIYGLFEPFKDYIHRERIESAAQRLGEVDKGVINGYVDLIPDEWDVDMKTRAALAEFICSRAAFLAENIVQTLSSVKHTNKLF